MFRWTTSAAWRGRSAGREGTQVKKTIIGAAFLAGTALVGSGVFDVNLLGYVINGPKWATSQVSYYINPQNSYLSDAAAISAIMSAAAGWHDQTRANIQLVYAGQTNGSSLTLNSKNEVFFRNTSSGYWGETYWWYDSASHIIDFDIVFYNNAPIYSGSGCQAPGIYLEDLAIHEFGHGIGLGHSQYGNVTMSANLPSYCDQTQLTLEPDDIAAIEAVYSPTSAPTLPAAPSQLSAAPTNTNPTSSLTLSWVDNANNEDGYRVERSPDGANFTQVAQIGANSRSYANGGLASSTTYYYRVTAYNQAGESNRSNTAAGQTQASAPTNTAPTVTISSPGNNASYPEGVSITFSGGASDAQDGSLSGNLRWTSNKDGSIGSGASFSRTLTVGTHSITASVTDGGGMSGSANITVTVASSAPQPAPAPAPTTPTLTARGYKVRGVHQADLRWSGFSPGTIVIYRDGGLITTSSGTRYADNIGTKGGGVSYNYRVCLYGTDTCSNTATVKF
jgi:matrixin/fibronectin type III domain protein